MHIDQLLEASYLGFEPEVPAFAWDRIESALDTNKKRFIWYTWHKIAIVAIIATLGYVGSRSFISSDVALVATQPAVTSQNQPQTSLNEKNSAEGNDQNQVSKEVMGSAEKNSVHVAPRMHQGNSTTADRSEATDAIADQGDVDSDQQAAAAGTETLKQFELLHALGFGSTDVDAMPEAALDANKKVAFQILPLSPYRHKWCVGFGLGQLVSSTGYTVNPEFNNYVHKNFTKRMSEGEGLLTSLNFSGSLGYRVAGVHFLFSGVNYYQRRNSLNFNFTDEAPALNAVNNPPLDRFGRYPIKDYLSSGIEVSYKGTNVVTAVELPLGWMAQIPLAKRFTFIPSVSANLGFLSQSASNVTLDYQFLEVSGVQKSWTRSNYILMNTTAGIYKDLGMRIQWGVGATANYTVTQMYVSGASVRPRAFTGGITTQLIWRLD